MGKEGGGERFRKAKEAWEKARERYAASLKPPATCAGSRSRRCIPGRMWKGWTWTPCPGFIPSRGGCTRTAYALTPWMQQMLFGFGTCENTRKRMETLVEQGKEGYFGHKVFNVDYDIPSMYGIDADHPEAEGNVGQCGVHLSTPEDYDERIRGWELETTNFSLITGENCLPGLAHIVAAAERRGKPTRGWQNHLIRLAMAGTEGPWHRELRA